MGLELKNPSKRNEKAKFLIHIGADFIVDSYCMRLDKLEPPVFGSNTPEQWILECCEKALMNENCSMKTFIIELEIKEITYVPKFNNANILIKMRADRDKKWFKQNKEGKINPSKRDDED